MSLLEPLELVLCPGVGGRIPGRGGQPSCREQDEG